MSQNQSFIWQKFIPRWQPGDNVISRLFPNLTLHIGQTIYWSTGNPWTSPRPKKCSNDVERSKFCQQVQSVILCTPPNQTQIVTERKYQTNRWKLSHVDWAKIRDFGKVESEILDSPKSEFHAQRASLLILMPSTLWHKYHQRSPSRLGVRTTVTHFIFRIFVWWSVMQI